MLKETDLPTEKEWETYFHPKRTLTKFGLRRGMTFLDLGCGYGTFSIPAAKIVGRNGLVYSIDIEEKMVKRVLRRAQSAGLKNIEAAVGDVTSPKNLELPPIDLALLANVIHGARSKVRLLRGVKRLLKPNGRVVVMNWNVDESTPRGPPIKMRPTEEDTANYLRRAGYDDYVKVFDMPPFHYAIVGSKS